jgi:hypothetical protein
VGKMTVAQGSFYSVEAVRRSGSGEVSDWQRWKFNASHFWRVKEGEESTRR